MNMKNPLSFQLNVDDFVPASKEEKESLSQMRPSIGFWKDAMRRLRKNPVAMVCFWIIVVIMILAFIVPEFYPYKYEEQIKYSTYLAPFEFSEVEQARIDDIISDRYAPVPVTTDMDALIRHALDQNFVPVVDDLERKTFMGIITRRAMLAYFVDKCTDSAP